MLLLQYMGMVSTLASASSLFVNLSVVWVALLSPVALKERLSGKKVAGVMVSLLGVVLMTTNLDFTSLDTADIMGNFLVIRAVVLLTEIIVAVAISSIALGEIPTVVSGDGSIFILIAILLAS